MSNEIRLEGLEEIVEKLQNMSDIGAYKQALNKACLLVEASAKQKAPKGDGELRRSIKHKLETDGFNLEGIVYTACEYAPYVEYGTGLFAEGGKGRKEVPWVYVEGGTQGSSSKTVYDTPQDAEAAAAYLRSKGLDAVVTYGQHPHPYLRPALNENRATILRLLKESINND